jgi:hypothetical protein
LKGDNSSKLSNFDAIVKIKKNADCRQKEKKKGGDEEGRNSLMPKPNEILQQVNGTSAIHCTTFFLSKGAWRHTILFFFR